MLTINTMMTSRILPNEIIYLIQVLIEIQVIVEILAVRIEILIDKIWFSRFFLLKDGLVFPYFYGVFCIIFLILKTGGFSGHRNTYSIQKFY